MKNLIEMLPFILLTSLVGFAFYSDPSNAQALIIASIAGLSGYKYHLLEKKKPDYVKLFKEQLDIIAKNSKEDAVFVKAELANINKKYGKVAIEQNQVRRVQQSSGW